MTSLELCREFERAEAKAISSSVREWAAAHPEDGFAVEPCAGGWLVFAGKGSFLSRAIGVGVDCSVTGEDLEQILAFFAARGESARVDISPASHALLAPRLMTMGFVEGDRKNVLGIELGVGAAALPEVEPPRGFSARWLEPEHETQIAEFLELAKEGFGLTSPAAMTAYRVLASHSTDRLMIASLDGNAAGSSVLARISGNRSVANLTSGSVLPWARRRGVQTAMMIERLRRAKAERFELGLVRSRPGVATERNAKRLGFRKVYEKFMLQLPG